MNRPARQVLVIRLGALGDFFLSFPAFAAIRAHEVDARITLLTTAAFAAIAEAAPWFDTVAIDARPSPWDLAGVLRLRRTLAGFDMVYDLQTSRRSSAYFRLAGHPPWSGIAPGCIYPHASACRNKMHTRERQREQLEMAGVATFPEPALGWLPWSTVRPNPPYALLVPGAAPHRPAKRWPVTNYAAVAKRLRERGIRTAVLGTKAEAPLAAAIPDAINLTGQTALQHIASLAQHAVFAVGNDTGPMHIITACGCPSVVLFSADSDPALTAPRGPGGRWPTVLRVPDLAGLPVDTVLGALPIPVGRDTAGSAVHPNPR